MTITKKFLLSPAAVVFTILFTITSAPKSFPSNEATACGQRPNAVQYPTPWIVMLRETTWPWSVVCVAVVIPRNDLPLGSDLLLTSPYCVKLIDTEQEFEALFSDSSTIIVLRRQYVLENTLGFVKLREPVWYSDAIQPICLPDVKTDIPRSGLTFQRIIEPIAMGHLTNWKEVQVDTVDPAKCFVFQKPSVAISQSQFCIASNKHISDGTGAPYYAYDPSLERFILWGIYDRSHDTRGTHMYFNVQSLAETKETEELEHRCKKLKRCISLLDSVTVPLNSSMLGNI